MGASLSTVGGWGVVLTIASYYVWKYFNESKVRQAAKAAAHRQRLEERQNSQSRKDNKDKAKRQRGDAYSKDSADADKTAKTRPRTAKPAPAAPSNPIPIAYSSDDGVDNREFAQLLQNARQGTVLNAPKKSDEKKQKSIKQSRAQEKVEEKHPTSTSAPSSTAGVDADDDESPIASPEVTPKDAGHVADMLEPKAAGPSVLRLTETEKVQKKPKKAAKEPEPTETKKQRQNRLRKEAEKAANEAAEAERKKMLENQRRTARIAEGRPAKDGSASAAAQKQPNAWTSNGVNGTKAPQKTEANEGFIPVQPLDTGDSSIHTDASVESAEPVKPVKRAPSTKKNGTWMETLPSEEEQMEMLRKEEEWSTVTTKKSTRKNKQPAAEIKEEPESGVSEPQQQVPVAPAPVAPKTQKSATNGKPAFSQKSSFAALSVNDAEPEVEEEWDI